MEVLIDEKKASALGPHHHSNGKGDTDETMSTCSIGSSLEDDLASVRIPKGFSLPAPYGDYARSSTRR